MSSSNFEIRFDSLNSGGGDTASSATYQLRDTTGEVAPGESVSTLGTYNLSAGYRAGIFDQVITFDVFNQNDSTQRAATASAGTTITCSTAGLSVGDFIFLVQDEGASQVSAVGRIISTGAGTITVDELKDGGTVPVIDGTNDFVYQADTSLGLAAPLGSLTTTAMATSLAGFNVSIDVDGGYSVQVFDDGNLRDGANDIDDVADGTVSIGSEEYGGRSSDTTLAGSTFDTVDTAFTTVGQEVATEGNNSFESRNFVTLKAAISGSTPAGSYAHVLSFVVSGNY